MQAKLKKNILNLLKDDISTNSIALGLALGTFICLLPTPFLNLFLLVLISVFFKKINRLALLSTPILWNAFLLMPIWALGGLLGSILLKGMVFGVVQSRFLNFLYHNSVYILVGTLLISVPLSIGVYFFSRHLIEKLRKKYASKD